MTGVSRRRFLQAAGATMVALGGPRLQASSRPTARALTAHASAYVAWYDAQMTAVVAQERYTQQQTAPNGEPIMRDLSSEIGWINLAGLDDAIAVRDVLEVDGVPTRQGGLLRRLLESPDHVVESSAAAILNESAAHNLVPTLNINSPTFPLAYLRGRFVDGSRWRVRDEDAGRLVLEFRERGRPTAVRGASGEHIRGQGRFWIDAGTGRVERSDVRFQWTQKLGVRWPSGPPPGGTYGMTVTFAHEPKVDLWVPTVMIDVFEGRRGTDVVRVTGEATYSNYRRFTTGGRLVTPGR